MEEINHRVINKTLSLLEGNKINPPFFKNLKNIGLSPQEIILVLEKFTKGIVDLELTNIVNQEGKGIYNEYSRGSWEKWNYDERGNLIHTEDNNGHFWTSNTKDTNEKNIHQF